MSALVVILISGAAVLLAIALAYVPLRILLTQMAKAVTEPIRAFIERQRERRAASRQTADRRKTM